jgi:hypothetical protein
VRDAEHRTDVEADGNDRLLVLGGLQDPAIVRSVLAAAPGDGDQP